jgi:hypothetical protein
MILVKRMNDDYPLYRFGRIAPALCGLAVACVVSAPDVQAQISGYGRSSAPISGGTGISATPANPFPPMPGTYVPAHKALDGKACISVHPSTRPQIINPKIIDQIVTVNNSCNQSIKVQVCYAGRSDCITVSLSGNQKLQRTLGIAAGSTSFRYEYRELF